MMFLCVVASHICSVLSLSFCSIHTHEPHRHWEVSKWSFVVLDQTNCVGHTISATATLRRKSRKDFSSASIIISRHDSTSRELPSGS